MQSSKKRIKIFEYFRNKVAPKGILFLQETYSSVETEKQWNDEFKGQLSFSHVNILILKTILFISKNMFQSIHTSSVAKSMIKTVNILNLHISQKCYNINKS